MIYNSVFHIVVWETVQSLQAAGISKAQETLEAVVLPVGYFGMGCARDRLHQRCPVVGQLRPTELLAHSPQMGWGDSWKGKSEKNHGVK